jgi:hypothetical protein
MLFMIWFRLKLLLMKFFQVRSFKLAALFCAVGFTLYAGNNAAQADGISLAITPVRFELNATPGAGLSQKVRVFTQGVGANVISELSDMTLNPGGQPVYYPASSLERSAASWVTVSPGGFQLPDRGALDVTVNLKVPNNPKLEGTYWTVVFFRSAPDAASSGQVNLNFAGRVGLVVYVKVGNGVLKGVASSLKFDAKNTAFSFLFDNKGNTVLRPSGNITLLDGQGTKVAQIPVGAFPVLPSGYREVKIDLPDTVKLASGSYVAVLTLDFGGAKRVVTDLNFKL